MTSRTAGIILAGGRSTRMGRPKALVPIAGRPMIEWVSRSMASACDPIVVVSSDPTHAGGTGARVVPDPPDTQGPLGGVASGLEAVDTDLAVVVACDMPFVDPGAIERLIASALGYESAVPIEADGTLQPLFAVYSSACVSVALDLLERGERAVRTLGRSVRTVYPDAELIDPTGLSWRSVDTPADLAEAERSLARGADQSFQHP